MGTPYAQGTMTLLGSLALACAAMPALAASGAPTPPAQTNETRPDPVCASYGKDFVRVVGTSTCIRVSGQVQGDVYQSSSRITGDALAPALRTR